MDEEKSKENDSDEVIDSSFLRVPDTIKTKKEHPKPPLRSRKQVLGEENNVIEKEKPVVQRRKHRVNLFQIEHQGLKFVEKARKARETRETREIREAREV